MKRLNIIINIHEINNLRMNIYIFNYLKILDILNLLFLS